MNSSIEAGATPLPELNITRLLFDLRRVNQVAQEISGNLNASDIARQITEALIQQFDCAFARLWVVAPDRTSLKLLASSGLHTRIDGDFAQVPMGAYKVGKIAQNRVPFLSNQLTQESWVKDRDWAIAHKLKGFAGYPLISRDRVIGVLVSFSHDAMAAEFLEVLQVLCMATAVGLDAAMQSQPQPSPLAPRGISWALSEWLAAVLSPTQLTLVGTERPVAPSIAYVVLRAAERLTQVQSQYCRLIYSADVLTLEAVVETTGASTLTSVLRYLSPLQRFVMACRGTLQLTPDVQGMLLQVKLSIPCAEANAVNGASPSASPVLSDREQEILALLGQGYRDRDIAETLHISQSTVKFHINNSIAKLKAKNRYQAVYEAAIHGWI
ncbi:MAG: LuxR C-terminal-related transcriptional regulator [Elainellaceae cyanobacterium]